MSIAKVHPLFLMLHNSYNMAI